MQLPVFEKTGMPEAAQLEECTVVEDGELIQQSRSGDLRAFEALYDRYKGQVYRAVLAITSDSVAAEDILQECFLRLHANIDRIDGSTPISPWLHRVAVNLAYNHMSRNKRRAGPLSAVIETLVAGVGGSPDRHAERHETNNVVQAAIASLSLSHRLVVTLSPGSGGSRSARWTSARSRRPTTISERSMPRWRAT